MGWLASPPVSAWWASNAIVFAALLLTPANRWWRYLIAGRPMHVLALASAMPLAQIGVHYIGTALKQL